MSVGPNSLFNKMEWSMIDSVKNFILHGFVPGSFTTHMINGNLHRALLSAHPGLEQYALVHYSHCELFVPDICRNTETWKGMSNETPNRRQIALKQAYEKMYKFQLLGDPGLMEDQLSESYSPWHWMTNYKSNFNPDDYEGWGTTCY